MCRRVFFGPRIPALAMVDEMDTRELFIALSLLAPTLLIGFWPKIITNIFESSSNAIANNLAAQNLLAILQISSLT